MKIPDEFATGGPATAPAADNAALSLSSWIVAQMYSLIWHSCKDGWSGITYQQALVFCAGRDMMIP